ncbi:MAG: anti-sigma factor [Betaproteobacteria bacterium]
MRLANENLRDKLAAGYVLGTMSARARRRFEIYLRGNPPLRRSVTQWEARLCPLAEALPPVQPPAHVWTAIAKRLKLVPASRPGFWNSLSFWRMASLACAVVAVALVAVGTFKQESPVQTAKVDAGRMVVVMNDVATNKPAMTASWDMGQSGDRMMRIRVMGHAEMGPNTSWELWMLPGGDGKPVSLGLITTHETQLMKIPAAMAARLDAAHGLAMSVEPAAGSPTGLPTGPVLCVGNSIRT